MKVAISQKALMDVLEKGSVAATLDDIQSSSSVASLLSKCVKITANNSLTVESSTELLSIKANVKTTEDSGIKVAEEGCVLVPAKELIHWAKVQNPDSTIVITLNKLDTPDIINTFEGDQSDDQDMSKYTVRKIGTIKLISKSASKTNGKWELDCFDPEQVTSVNYDQKMDKCFDIQGGQLIDSLNNISFASKAKDENHIWDAISFQVFKEDLYFTASDQIRCALYKIAKVDLRDVSMARTLLASTAILNQITKIISKGSRVSFYYSEDSQKIFIIQDDIKIRIVSTDKEQMNKFPKVEMLLNKPYQPLVDMTKSGLNELLVSASVVNSSCALFVFNKTDGTFTVKAISEENKYKPSIKQTTLDNIGRDAKVVWAVKHLIEGLKVLKTDSVSIALPENLRSVRITTKDDANFYYYVMSIENNPHYKNIEG